MPKPSCRLEGSPWEGVAHATKSGIEMRWLRAVFASDTVNRYGSRLSVEALVSALWDNCEIDNPLLLSHDLTRPIGWSRAVTVHMEPGLSRLVGQQLLPEDEDEVERLASALDGYLQKKLVDEFGGEVERLRGLASEHLLGQETPHCRGCVALVEADLAKEPYRSPSPRETRTVWCPSAN